MQEEGVCWMGLGFQLPDDKSFLIRGILGTMSSVLTVGPEPFSIAGGLGDLFLGLVRCLMLLLGSVIGGWQGLSRGFVLFKSFWGRWAIAGLPVASIKVLVHNHPQTSISKMVSPIENLMKFIVQLLGLIKAISSFYAVVGRHAQVARCPDETCTIYTLDGGIGWGRVGLGNETFSLDICACLCSKRALGGPARGRGLRHVDCGVAGAGMQKTHPRLLELGSPGVRPRAQAVSDLSKTMLPTPSPTAGTTGGSVFCFSL